MKTVMKKLVASTLRYAARQVLQRPWLKKRIREALTRLPGLHGMAIRVLSNAPLATQSKLSGDEKNLSPNALRTYRALKHAMRTYHR